MTGLKYDVYLRGKFLRMVVAACPTGALNEAVRAFGYPSLGTLVVVRSDLRGDPVTAAVEASHFTPGMGR